MSHNPILDKEAKVCFNGNMTKTQTPRVPTPGTQMIRSKDGLINGWHVIPTDTDLHKIPSDWFVVQSARTNSTFYGQMTGNTRYRWFMDCPTLILHRVETVVTDHPTKSDEYSIVGKPGERIEGTYSVRPETMEVPVGCTRCEHVNIGEGHACPATAGLQVGRLNVTV